MLNNLIQSALGDRENDGLILEDSADSSRWLSGDLVFHHTHYPNYNKLAHDSICESEYLAKYVYRFANEVVQ